MLQNASFLLKVAIEGCILNMLQNAHKHAFQRRRSFLLETRR